MRSCLVRLGGIRYGRTRLAGHIFAALYGIDLGAALDDPAVQPRKQGEPMVLAASPAFC